ncbi:phosphodiester glycosidase family protein [Petrachloros mirabilis]
MTSLNYIQHLLRLLTVLAVGVLQLTFQPTKNVFAQPVSWNRLAEGLSIGLWTPSDACPNVAPIIVADIDPNRYRFAIHYYRNESFDEPLDIREWQSKTGQVLLFNAGLFRDNYSYLGLLYGEGQSLGSKRHGTWMGLFVAEPTVSGKPSAGILDLAHDAFDEGQPPYKEAAQSLMLLDRSGKIRVRRSGKQAQQTIVAESTSGHILVFKTTESTTLHDIGQCLRDTYPNVRQAMAMDGGSSSDMSISSTFSKDLASSTLSSSWVNLLNLGPSGHMPLPAVIGISPR